MKKDITFDGLQKTTYMKDDMEGKIVTKEEVNIDPHIQHNKRLYNFIQFHDYKTINLSNIVLSTSKK